MEKQRYRTIKITIDRENPTHRPIAIWLARQDEKASRFMKGSTTRHSRLTSFHLLNALNIYVDIMTNRAKLVYIERDVPVEIPAGDDLSQFIPKREPIIPTNQDPLLNQSIRLDLPQADRPVTTDDKSKTAVEPEKKDDTSTGSTKFGITSSRAMVDLGTFDEGDDIDW